MTPYQFVSDRAGAVNLPNSNRLLILLASRAGN